MTQFTNSSDIFQFINQPHHKIQTVVDAIQRLSDFFVTKPDDLTPWDYEYCQIAYRYYYLPLNFIRNFEVIKRGLQVDFFKDLTTSVDWGCGPGTASLALTKVLPFKLQKQLLIDQSKTVHRHFADIHRELSNHELSNELSLKELNLNYAKSLLVLSYSLTEMSELPTGFDQFDSLMILEPSTQDDGRKLQQLREKLIAYGYYIWAPCVHQQKCPLLHESKTDWCHDRFHVNAPAWFLDFEKHLPFRNRTITTSYLLAKRTQSASYTKNAARTVGDSVEEKGKNRQLVCRSSQREFLTWMHKNKNVQIIPRGELIELPEDIELKSNELRINSEIKFTKSRQSN